MEIVTEWTVKNFFKLTLLQFDVSALRKDWNDPKCILCVKKKVFYIKNTMAQRTLQ